VIKEAVAAAPSVGACTKAGLCGDAPEAYAEIGRVVAQAKEGDPEALRFLYARYSRNIYGYAISIVRDSHEAEDVTQHVFAKLLTSITDYDERGFAFSAWLGRLARNVAIDHLRAKRPTPTENVLSPESSSDPDLDQSETVRLAFKALPEDQRTVVFLRHVVGLTPGEIAQHMGRTESAVHGLHHRGRHALQAELRRLHAIPLTRGPRRLAVV
jgi:RNA polymerase sigma-70 factor (ECF subfamily)